MFFQLTIKSKFQGEADFVQLVKAYNDSDWYPFRVDTHGQFWLDNIDPYSTADPAQSFPDYYQLLPRLTDHPSFPGYYYIIKTGHYKSYCRFRPGAATSSSNIWVTLGVVQWQWEANAANGVILYSDCPPPEFDPSREFPVWSKVLHNSIPYW